MMIELIKILTVSDWIDLFGIITSLIVSIVAIVISVITIRQNNQMIEESTRPYIVVCGKTANCSSPKFYLVVKNYGTSGAVITKFKCNYDLKELSIREKYCPFEHIQGTFIAPNQSFITNLDKVNLFAEDRILKFDIEYKLNKKTYSDHFEIPIKAFVELIQTRTATQGQELKVISYALQDLVEKQL